MNQTQFDSRMPLFIPLVFPEHANVAYIASVFTRLGVGQVARVDLVEKTNLGRYYYQAFVHFTSWYTTNYTAALQEKINNPSMVAKLVHIEKNDNQQDDDQQQAFWILNRCLNPETLLEKELKQQLFDHRVQAYWELKLAEEHSSKQETLINNLFELVDRQAAEIVALKQSQQSSIEFVEDPKEGLSAKWLALSDKEKLDILNTDLDDEYGIRNGYVHLDNV